MHECPGGELTADYWSRRARLESRGDVTTCFLAGIWSVQFQIFAPGPVDADAYYALPAIDPPRQHARPCTHESCRTDDLPEPP